MLVFVISFVLHISTDFTWVDLINERLLETDGLLGEKANSMK